MTLIDSFHGEYDFLSNFFACEVWYDYAKYPSVEHAYSAAKTLDTDERWLIQSASTPGKAKGLGRGVVLREQWDTIKIPIMYGLLQQKFEYESELAKRLMATGDAELIEGNSWGDTFWGVCKGVGENHLGKLLMHWRGKLFEIDEIEKAKI